MGKLIALLSAGSGTVVVSVGGFYMVKNGLTGESEGSEQSQEGSTGEEMGKQENPPQASKPTGQNAQEVTGTPESSTTTITPVNQEELELSTLNEFKNKEGYKCVSSLFGEQDLEFSSSDLSTLNFFGSPADDANQIKSCLIINWEKKTYTSTNKWSGTFAWTWSFMNDNKGFVVVNKVDAGTDSSSALTLKGGAYLLEKTTGGKWEVKYKQEETTDVVTTGNAFEQKLPKAKAGSGVTVGMGDNTNYWGWFKDQNDLKNICDDDDSCSGGATSTKAKEEFKWTWQDGGEKNISEWCENLNWWNSIYGNSTFDLSSKLESFKGTWSKVDSSTFES